MGMRLMDGVEFDVGGKGMRGVSGVYALHSNTAGANNLHTNIFATQIMTIIQLALADQNSTTTM